MRAPAIQQGVFYRLSTGALPQRQRFDYWAALHANLNLGLARREAHGHFNGALLECVGADGVLFGQSSSVDTMAHFGPANPDLILISGTVCGAVHLRHSHDSATKIVPASGLSLFDYRRRATATTPADYCHLYLVLPVSLVIGALGNEIVARREAVRSLPDTGLFPFLWSHMTTLAKCGEQLDRRDAIAAMQIASSLAATGLQQLRGKPLDEEENTAGDALFAAARHFINTRCSNGELTAGLIAATLGCSRAHLYRVFAAHGMTIGDYARVSRLERAKAMLGGRTAIARIAWETGYSDVASFGRAFKRQFGVSPGEYRDRMRNH